MSLQVAMNNWRNWARQAVGLPKIYPVKIVRDREAFNYPLIAVKKDGDVGYDLPTTKEIVIPAASPRAVNNYTLAIHQSRVAEENGDHEIAKIYSDLAMTYLPKANIPTGIKIEMPNNIWASIEARSSSSSKLLITPDSIIDAGYRGQLFAVVYNFGYEDYVVQPGERLVQVIFHERILARFEETYKLSDSERGETGFGSTGRK